MPFVNTILNLRINPEIIFLQEMTNALMSALTDLMESMYHIFISNPTFPYYCVTLVSKNIQIERHDILQFHDTSMGRSAIVVEVSNEFSMRSLFKLEHKILSIRLNGRNWSWN